MKKCIVFFGSGVSIASEMPSVEDISEAIFNKEFTLKDNIPKKFYNTYLLDRIRKLLSFLLELDAKLSKSSAPRKGASKIEYSGSLFKRKSSYEDLYFIVSEIHKSGMGLSNNLAINTLIFHIVRKGKNLLNGNRKRKKMYDQIQLSRESMYFLNWLIPNLLKHKKVEGIDLLGDLIKNHDHVSIITLNHDLIVEDYLSSQMIPYDDGFNTAVKKVEIPFSNFKLDSAIKLIKPHGSINWLVKND